MAAAQSGKAELDWTRRARLVGVTAPVAFRVDDTAREVLQWLGAALVFVEDIRGQLRRMAEPTISASAESDTAARALFADEYDDRRDELVRMIEETTSEGRPLITADTAPIKLSLPPKNDYVVHPSPIGVDPSSLNLPPPKAAFSEHAEIAMILDRLDGAFTRLDRTALRFKQDQSFLDRHINGANDPC
jgi:hypothetical protein